MRGKGAVAQLFDQGESHFAYPIRYVVLPTAQVESEQGQEQVEGEKRRPHPIELLFNVPKRYQRRANKRNLLRRRIKEAYRLGRKDLRLSEFKSPLRIALIYSTKEVVEYAVIERSIGKIIKHLNEKFCSE